MSYISLPRTTKKSATMAGINRNSFTCNYLQTNRKRKIYFHLNIYGEIYCTFFITPIIYKNIFPFIFDRNFKTFGFLEFGMLLI